MKVGWVGRTVALTAREDVRPHVEVDGGNSIFYLQISRTDVAPDGNHLSPSREEQNAIRQIN